MEGIIYIKTNTNNKNKKKQQTRKHATTQQTTHITNKKTKTNKQQQTEKQKNDKHTKLYPPPHYAHRIGVYIYIYIGVCGGYNMEGIIWRV